MNPEEQIAALQKEITAFKLENQHLLQRVAHFKSEIELKNHQHTNAIAYWSKSYEQLYVRIEAMTNALNDLTKVVYRKEYGIFRALLKKIFGLK